MEVYIPYDPYDTAEKEVANYINNYNENNENSLELMKLYEDSIPRYDYVAECTMTIAGSTEKKEVFLYCEVFGDGNDFCKIEPQGLNNYGFSENEIKIMELGNFYNEYALLDGDLNYFSTDEEGQRIYNDYCEGLRNLVAKEIQDQLVVDNKWYENEYGNDVIDFRIQSPNCSIENPYVKLIFCDSDGKVIQQMTKSISATFDNKGTAVSLNLGKCKTEACRFEFSVLANEVFSKEWLENYLLNEYTWKGYEDAGRFCYGAYGEANIKGINVLANKNDEIEFGEREYLQFYFIKYFDLENSSK